jgi:hypothetical protein
MPTSPSLEFVMEALVTVASALDIGATPRGERRIIPITGGMFEGPALRGHVVPGGADWQIIRSDGVIELEARYTLMTDAGGLIYVVNRGIRHGCPGDQCYFRAAPVFETAVPELAWMMRSVFLCEAERLVDQVVIRFWRVV